MSARPAGTAAVDVEEVWEVDAPTGDHLQILLGSKVLDVTEELGIDPGLQKDGVEAHLQELLAENPPVSYTHLTLPTNREV